MAHRLTRVGAVAAALIALGGACSAPDAEPVGWDRATPVEGDTAVRVEFARNDCTALDRAAVDYGADRVTITLFVVERGGRCADVVVPDLLHVPLHEPVAGRRIVDGSR